MIIDLQKFVEEEKPFWEELEDLVKKWEDDSSLVRNLEHAKRFHYLYQRASSDLGQLMTYSAEQDLRTYLEALVARAYSEIHEVRGKPHKFLPVKWFFQTFPATFRRYIHTFYLVLGITTAGVVFGGLAVSLDPDAKSIIMPFAHLQTTPTERVAREMETKGKNMQGTKSQFSTQLMTHNIQVSITALALGLTFGVGTIIVIFYNGIILGAVCLDYILDGQTEFLLGWLLPHGSVEIPAFLLAGQAGLILAHALVGRGDRRTRQERVRQITPDLTTLIFGVAIMLVWAGIIEAFFSQYHEPILPYALKIGFGTVELILLMTFLFLGGTSKKQHNDPLAEEYRAP